MDTILKSFSIGFFLRSTLSGVFFVLSLGVGLGVFPTAYSNIPVSLVFSISVFSGAAVYSCHRAILYPLIEWGFDSRWCEKARRRVPLISALSREKMVLRWRWSCAEADLDKTLFSHTSTWADYTHFLYASSFAVVLGSCGACIIRSQFLAFSFPLCVLAVLLLFVAFVSDWRLHSLHDYLFDRKKPQQDEAGQPPLPAMSDPSPKISTVTLD